MNRRKKRGMVLLLAFIMTISASLAAYAAGAVQETKEANIAATGSMFKKNVQETGTLKINEDGTMDAVITYNSLGYLSMYMGTAQEAETAFQGKLYCANYEKTTGIFKYTIPVSDSQLGTPIQAAVLSGGEWKENTITVTKEAPDSAQAAITVSGAKMFAKKVSTEGTWITKDDGTTYVELTYEGTAYLSMYLGTKTEAEKACGGKYYSIAYSADGNHTFTVPVPALGEAFQAAVFSSSQGKWKENTLTVSLKEEAGSQTPSEPENPTEPSVPETPTEVVVIVPDGTYTIQVTSSAAMFKITACTLTAKEQKLMAALTLSGTGYDKLYLGTAAAAAKAAQTEMISHRTDSEGRYVFDFPVASLDKEIAVAAHSSSKDSWYDRTLVFQSSTLAMVQEQEKTDSGTDTTPSTVEKEDTSQSGYTNSKGELTEEGIRNLESTIQKGEVLDGTYKPSFGFTGGTGKTKISCDKVVVKNGKATATITFSSASYTWVKVNGTKYTNQNQGGNSTFTIPINLNGKTSIVAETTAMSAAHEIDYVLYCYVDGTVVKTSKTTQSDSDGVIDLTGNGKDASGNEDTLEENGWGSFDNGSNSSDRPVQVTVNQPSNIPVIVLCILTGILDIYVIGASIFFLLRWKKTKKGA